MNALSLVIKCPNLQVPLAENTDHFPLKLTFLPFLPLSSHSGCVCRTSNRRDLLLPWVRRAEWVSEDRALRSCENVSPENLASSEHGKLGSMLRNNGLGLWLESDVLPWTGQHLPWGFYISGSGNIPWNAVVAEVTNDLDPRAGSTTSSYWSVSF